MKCEHCAGCLTVYAFQRRLAASAPQMVKCEKCGSSHALLGNTASAINPRPLPIGAGVKRMPWRDASTRPIDAGMYECRFRNTEPRLIPLYWDGAAFYYHRRIVTMTTFMAWRGEWEA